MNIFVVCKRGIIATIESQQTEEKVGIVLGNLHFHLGFDPLTRKGGTWKKVCVIVCACASSILIRNENMSDDKIKAANLKIDLQELSLEDDMNTTKTPSSPTSRKSSATKINCLCAPTNHPGSFRCRRHRTNLSGLGNRRTVSVGSNLHQLGNTTTTTTTPKQSREY